MSWFVHALLVETPDRERLLSAIGELTRREGYTEVTPGDRWDVEVAISVHHGWTAVLPPLSARGVWAEGLSVDLETTALEVAKDDELLELLAYREGRQVDHFASDPELLVEASAAAR